MANPEHLRILERGVKAWNEWRDEHPGTVPEFDRADLIQARLCGANLTKANLRGANLLKANLADANLLESDLNEADLSGAYLNVALLARARLSRANLSLANLKGASLTGANLTGANLIRGNLGGADLSQADLSGAKLTTADLRNANLRKANLFRADLGGAELSGASLCETNLRQTNLAEASLCEANLNDSDLDGTNLTGADLRGATLGAAKLINAHLNEANLTGACLCGTVLASVDLSVVVGLETVAHTGPSTIGIDTFFRSAGKIPEIFLRGAGVPEPFIQYAASLTGTAFEFYSCFISYSHADKAFARRLHDTLQGQGIRCWLDEKQLLPGDHIHKEIDQAVRVWDKVLLCCSEKSLASWWVDKEISKALKKEEQLWKERGKQVLAVIPLNLDGYMFRPDWDDWKRQHLLDRMAADFTGWEKDNTRFEQELQRVIKALRADAGARDKPPPPRL